MSLLAFCLLGVSVFRASVASSHCQLQQDGSEICAISVKAGLDSRMYQYEIRRAKAGEPTVVVLPGGPGQGAIGDIETLAMVQLIPSHFGVIAIDPRGVGRNDFGEDREEVLYSSENVAHDVYEVIRHEELKEYIIFGESYGTVVATHLAHFIAEAKSPGESTVALPKAVVLSRVVGDGFKDQIGNYNLQLQRLSSAYSATELALIRKELKNIYYTFYKGNDTAFSAAIMQALLFNIEAKKPGPLSVAPSLRALLDKFANRTSYVSDPVYQMLTQGYNKHLNQFPLQASGTRRNFGMAETIKCRELSNIAEEAQTAFNFEKLRLTLLQNDCLNKGIALTRPYHSSYFQMDRVPVFYLQGNLDPVTPLPGALSHYFSQRNSDKVFIEMKGFAHVGFVGLWPCRDGLWSSFAKGTKPAADHIRQCAGDQISMIDPLVHSAETRL